MNNMTDNFQNSAIFPLARATPTSATKTKLPSPEVFDEIVTYLRASLHASWQHRISNEVLTTTYARTLRHTAFHVTGDPKTDHQILCWRSREDSDLPTLSRIKNPGNVELWWMRDVVKAMAKEMMEEWDSGAQCPGASYREMKAMYDRFFDLAQRKA